MYVHAHVCMYVHVYTCTYNCLSALDVKRCDGIGGVVRVVGCLASL